MNSYYVYIMASKTQGILYVGVTSDLIKRGWQHKHELVGGFTKTYKTKRLVYFEQCSDIETAIVREKQVKHWNRQWKIDLIAKQNPGWDDLYQSLL